MKSAEIRQSFLSFFESKGHQPVASSSLIPGNDPTLLFTNAGMVQFKDVFLGEDERDYRRAASSQRCVRAGGKHNDLENVGYTARHHTFFEMLGNFSFGDYFKRDAISYAWEFLTQVLKLPEEKLWITVHISDDEAADIWIKEIGIDPSRFSRLDEDNFWQMGDTGPCGPSSEIFYDHGEAIPGGPPGSENDDLDRYIEIWNLVFMQYEKQPDGELIPLPKPSVDTGMGLERIAAVMQGVHNNYDIDLFQVLLKAASAATNCEDTESKSLRVIADHIRSCSFLITDGVIPSNEGRGYVLRRIIRRAIRHGNKLGQNQNFFSTLVPALVDVMGGAYPELVKNQDHIQKVLLAEEEQFAKTLEKGMLVLEEKLEALNTETIPGDVVFTLYDTFGFPLDLTNDIARERGLTLDTETYDRLMDEQKKKSRGAASFEFDYTQVLSVDGFTKFEGYQSLTSVSSIKTLITGNEPVEHIVEGDEAVVVLPNTPFYAESGGQVGDSGFIESGSARFEVHACQKSGSNHLHFGKLVQGEMKTGDAVNARVDTSVRAATALNHSATHLLHAALREILGEHVTQKGSLVDSQRLRFDFSHIEAVSTEELKAIEQKVNQEIWRNTAIETKLCDMESAKAMGAMALFGEKYGDEVRVLSMGDGYSMELCGGTHANRTGDIGLMRIVSETGIAAGVRRIEALTGRTAFNYLVHAESILDDVSGQLKSSADTVSDKVKSMLAVNKALEKELSSLKGRLAAASIEDWLVEAKEVNGVKVLAKVIPGNDSKTLRELVDKLKNKLGTSAVLLAGTDGEKVALVAGVTKDAVGRIKAGDLVRQVAEQIGAKGGGRPDMAQGGGADNGKLQEAIDSLLKKLMES